MVAIVWVPLESGGMGVPCPSKSRVNLSTDALSKVSNWLIHMLWPKFAIEVQISVGRGESCRGGLDFFFCFFFLRKT